MRHRTRTVARMLLGLALLACGGGGTEPTSTDVAAVTVTSPVSILSAGTSTTAKAKAFGAAGSELGGKDFTWSAHPAGIVTVTANG